MTEGVPSASGEPSGGPAWGETWDHALQRLEEFVADYPSERALPNLDTIVQRASVPRDFLHRDERAHKVLHEAMAGRPLSEVEQVAQLRSEVELLTLEVEVILDRLDGDLTPREVRRNRRRLRDIRARLSEIRNKI